MTSYKSAGLILVEITRECQGLATKEVLISLCSLLDRELSDDVPSYRSPLYPKALNYLRRFWNGMFAFLSDGELPIDNNLAERIICKLTTQRNNSFHYGSDIGVEMAATYHNVISTVKFHGHSVWDFIGSFFKKIFNGCGDYVNIALARSVWPPSNVKIRIIYLAQLSLGYRKVS